MLPSDIATRVRYITKTTATDGTGDDTNLLAIINDYYSRQITTFVNTNQDKFGVIAVADLDVTANQEVYALPADMIKMKRLEITYDGSQWRKIHMTDVGLEQEYATDPKSIANEYSQADPHADIFGDNLMLRPIPSVNVVGGLKMWYIGRPVTLSTMSAALQTPVDYQGYLVYGVAAEVATRQGNETLASAMFQKWEDGNKKIITTFAQRDLDELVDSTPQPVNYG